MGLKLKDEMIKTEKELEIAKFKLFLIWLIFCMCLFLVILKWG